MFAFGLTAKHIIIKLFLYFFIVWKVSAHYHDMLNDEGSHREKTTYT